MQALLILPFAAISLVSLVSVALAASRRRRPAELPPAGGGGVDASQWPEDYVPPVSWPRQPAPGTPIVWATDLPPDWWPWASIWPATDPLSGARAWAPSWYPPSSWVRGQSSSWRPPQPRDPSTVDWRSDSPPAWWPWASPWPATGELPPRYGWDLGSGASTLPQLPVPTVPVAPLPSPQVVVVTDDDDDEPPPFVPGVLDDDDIPDAPTVPVVPPPVVPASPLPQLEVQDPTMALARQLLAEEQGPGWRREVPEVRAWQTGQGLVVDGKFGPKSAIRMAESVGVLPLIRYWAKGGKPKSAQLDEYRASLRGMAARIEQTGTREARAHAEALRASAEREQAQGWPSSPPPTGTGNAAAIDDYVAASLAVDAAQASGDHEALAQAQAEADAAWAVVEATTPRSAPQAMSGWLSDTVGRLSAPFRVAADASHLYAYYGVSTARGPVSVLVKFPLSDVADIQSAIASTPQSMGRKRRRPFRKLGRALAKAAKAVVKTATNPKALAIAAATGLVPAVGPAGLAALAGAKMLAKARRRRRMSGPDDLVQLVTALAERAATGDQTAAYELAALGHVS